MTDEEKVSQALAELWDIVKCRCHEAYTGRGLHDPDCQCDSTDALQIVTDRIKELAEERDGYLAERNKFQLYLQRTHADWELEVAAVDALSGKLTKAVEALKKLDRRGDALETFDPVVHEIVTAALAELEGK